MKCNDCNEKNASVFYREIVNGKETSLCLCADCAKKREDEGTFQMPKLSSPFGASFFDSFFAPVKLQGKQRDQKRCTLCGMTFSDVAKAGMAGCPECYNVFSEELLPTLSRLHGSTVHKGRGPMSFDTSDTKDVRVIQLEKDLARAIEEERYEDCAAIRDSIKKIKEEE